MDGVAFAQVLGASTNSKIAKKSDYEVKLWINKQFGIMGKKMKTKLSEL